MSGPRRLNLIAKEQELSGKGPAAFERISRSCEVASIEHIRLVQACVQFSRRAVLACVPPSGRRELEEALAAAELWVSDQSAASANESSLRKLRAACFAAVRGIEEMCSAAIAKALEQNPGHSGTLLDPHADHVVDRYARLAAHFATSAVCHTIDGIFSPPVLLEVLQDTQGARAYQATGLGSARHAAFRTAAYAQAEWEASRSGGASGPLLSSLAVQVFHEYLGGRYRVHADAEALYQQQEFERIVRGGHFASLVPS